MYETLLRPHEVSQIPQLQSIGHVSQKLKEAEKRREEKRLRQIANNKARLNTTTTTTTLTKRKRDDPLDNNDNDNDYSTEHDLPPSEAKRVKSSETEAVDKDEMMIKVDDDDDTTTHNRGGSTLPVSKQSRISVSNALPDVRGHTSYLTFAVLVPLLSTPPPREDEMAEQQPSGSG